MAFEYPLESTWTMWRNDVPTMTCSEVGEFWECFATHDGMDTVAGERLGLFKHGVVPDWRRREHRAGGHMKFKARSVITSLELWKALALRCIGELIPHSEHVLGVMLEVNGGGEHNRLQVWVNGPVKESVLADITAYLNVEVDPELYFGKRGALFMSHKEAVELGTTKPKYHRNRRTNSGSDSSSGGDSPTNKSRTVAFRPKATRPRNAWRSTRV